MSIPNEELNKFLTIYFYELENLLKSKADDLKLLKFQSEEANTDEFIKKYVKELILSMPTIKDSELLFLEVVSENGDKNGVKISEFFSYEIVNVFLPEELLPEHRKSITELKESVYTHPDLYLEIKNEDAVYFQSVEIKSTKQNNIPGSSIQQVSPFEWVVFIKRGKEMEVSTGFYINSVTEKLPFPDRSPRPQVGFNTLKNWNKKHRAHLKMSHTKKAYAGRG